MSKQFSGGKLYIVATPIGNLADVTFRAVKTLGEVDLVAAEDTRKARILLDHYNIRTPLTSFFSAGQRKKAPELIEKLKNGTSIALISEAGTPGISDPGNYLVGLARKENIEITPIPGASAIAAAFSVCGMPFYSFSFFGFLAPKGNKRNRALRSIAALDHAVMLYESPHRIKRTLADILKFCGERNIFIAREITKIYEEFIETTVSAAIAHFETTEPRGEFTIIIGAKIENEAGDDEEEGIKFEGNDDYD